MHTQQITRYDHFLLLFPLPFNSLLLAALALAAVHSLTIFLVMLLSRLVQISPRPEHKINQKYSSSNFAPWVR